MVHNLVHNLCESLVTNIGGVADTGKKTPTPITYLTQWKMLGNSEVHTLPYPDGVVLPNGYKRCKYLEFSNGKQYFDSGIIPEQGIELHAKYMMSQNSYITGVRTGAFSRDSFYILIGGSPASYQVSYGGKVLDSNSEDKPSIEYDTLMEVALTSQTFRLNNYTKNVKTTIIKGSKSIYIGAVNGLPANSGLVKIYEYSLSLNNAVIFNGIPCLDDNNVPCLYDTVSRTTLYNQGTGTLGYEIEPQPTEIWSCGEYSEVDGKYHILVKPQGGSIADIALTEPLRMINDIVDTIEFPSGTEGKALVTRYFVNYQIKDFEYSQRSDTTNCHRIRTLNTLDTINYDSNVLSNTLTVNFINKTLNDANNAREGYYVTSYNQYLMFYVPKSVSQSDFETTYGEDEILVELATPTTELVDAPQIEEAESYTCEISQGGKAVEWSSFITD